MQTVWIVRIRQYLMSIVCLILMFAADAEASPFPTLELDSDYKSEDIVPFIRFQKDFQGQVTRSAIMESQSDFKGLERSVLNFGSNAESVLIILKLKNTSDRQTSWFVSTNRHSAKRFRILDLTTKDTQELFNLDTYYYRSDSSIRRFTGYGTELSFAPGEEILLAIDADFENSTNLHLDILTPRSFFDRYFSLINRYAALSAALLAIILLNLILFIVTGKQAFVWLSGAELSFTFIFMNTSGFLFALGWYQFPIVQSISVEIAKWTMGASLLQFTRRMLSTTDDNKQLDFVLKSAIGVCFLFILLWGLSYFAGKQMRVSLLPINWIVVVSVAFGMPYFGAQIVRKLGGAYWPLFVGFSIYALCAAYLFLGNVVDPIPLYQPITLMGISGLIESFLVTVSLGWGIFRESRIHASNLEEKLKLSEERTLAEATIRDQNAMLHASGHDTRQVLLALNNAAQHLETTSGEGNVELVQTIRSSADFLQDILSTTVAAPNAYISSRRCTALGAFAVADLFRDLGRIYRPLFFRKHLKYDISIEPSLQIVSDRALLMRALSNFMINSLQNTDSGGLRCMVSNRKGEAILVLEDTGRGMSDELLQELMKNDEKQSGFRIARSLVTQVCGALKVESSEDVGTRLSIRLPCAFVERTRIDSSTLVESLQLSVHHLDNPDASTRTPDAIGITSDQSSYMRTRASENFSVIVYKPLCEQMLHHPALLSIRSDQALEPSQ